MTYQNILFDLDGTLTDPKEGITKCVAFALNKFNIKVENPDQLIPFIGPPLHESFIKYYKLSKIEANQAVEYYRERFKSEGIYENEILPGISNLLNQLKDEGKNLYVATSKPTIFAEVILKHFSIDKYFNDIVGSNLDGTRSAKHEIISYILEKESINVENSIMIGDREHDIIGANIVGMNSIGVTFGYGSEVELKEAGATHIVENIYQLGTLLCSNKLLTR